MNDLFLSGWESLRHGGLLLDPPRLREIAAFFPEPLVSFYERELRRRTARQLDPKPGPFDDLADFAGFVLQKVCGFSEAAGVWQRGPLVDPAWNRPLVTGGSIKPRLLWQGHRGGILPVFLDREPRLGSGRGRKATSQALQWLRSGREQLAVVTNGRQWRLVFAGLDFDAWCEWDLELWFEGGELSPHFAALRTLLQPPLWEPAAPGSSPRLLQAILDSRKGQADLSAVLGERVREAVELLVQAHGEALKEQCAEVDPADIYRAAVRIVMRMVVILFAESRDLLPRDNALYYRSYGLNGLLDELEKAAARGRHRLAHSWNAWPRVLALFRLIYHGSHHPQLPVPAYGGELFTPGERSAANGLIRSQTVFETAAFEQELLPDRDVYEILRLITRTKVKLRQGRTSTSVTVPVDFSDLSSEYIGILYEGLLDFELKTAPAGDPVIFLAVGNQPALPLSRLEAMDDKALANLLEKMKDTSQGEEKEEGQGEEPGEAEDEAEEEAEAGAAEGEAEPDEELSGTGGSDPRHITRTRAEIWARRAVEAGKLVRPPRAPLTPEKRLAYDASVAQKARQLVLRVVLPGELYLVRWGGTRKGAGTFYTRPGLAVPTVQRTLRPLAFTPPCQADGSPDLEAPATAWTPKTPEEILALRVCDPACGSGTFPVAALRFLTEALFAALHHHQRISADGDRALVRLLTAPAESPAVPEERLVQELLPARPDDPLFEPRLKAILRRHVVERSIYGVDLDPLAVELCRLSLWIETMDRTLPFSFLDHKIKCGNALVGAWFDQFQHFPVMAYKNREGGDKNHTNGVHFEKEARTRALKTFVKDRLTPDLRRFLSGPTLFSADLAAQAASVHDEALATLSQLHELPVQDSAERARLYREQLLNSPAYRSLKQALDLWCACWFWPADQLDQAPLPSSLAAPPPETTELAARLAAQKRFFHWELEFPDVFRKAGSGFDAILGNPPWENLQPNPEEFFSNVDPLFRTYGRLVKQSRQRELFEADGGFERSWLEYSADFNDFANWVGHVANPFGDQEQSSGFSFGKNSDALHENWRKQRLFSPNFAPSGHPFQFQLGRLFTYKLFLELSYVLLREGGRLGQIVPSGLYSDAWSKPLRELFLDRCRWEWLFGFENRNKIFAIDSRFKFNPLIIEKGGMTESIRTAFMRRQLEDWEKAEEFTIPYTRSQIENFSPRSKVILEIQSQRDLAILEKIYSNSVLLGEEGSNSWHVKYKIEFMMNTDASLFPPRPKWEAEGYCPDEYSRWLKGDWRPISELWAELGTNALPPGEKRCAQPPYDTLPIPRADIPAGIILSRAADSWIREEKVEDLALPLYEGRMIGQFDFSQKGWISGKGRTAKWPEIPFASQSILPQYCMSSGIWTNLKDKHGGLKSARGHKIGFMDVASATNEKTMISSIIREAPCGNSVPVLTTKQNPWVFLGILNSFGFDFVSRRRCSGLHLNYYVIEECPLPTCTSFDDSITLLALRLSAISVLHSDAWIQFWGNCVLPEPFRRLWAIAPSERLRLQAISSSLFSAFLGVGLCELKAILEECDHPVSGIVENNLKPKGFWRVDKDKDPELRHTLLTLVAFHDLEEKIRACGGDREKGIEAFLNQNDGEGWMLPETLRLADYGLGHDDRALHPQPVASRLGPRIFDWQLSQSPEESWRECHLHARNLLGEEGYRALLQESNHPSQPEQTDPTGFQPFLPGFHGAQGRLFDIEGH